MWNKAEAFMDGEEADLLQLLLQGKDEEKVTRGGAAMSERPYDICPDCDRGSEALYAMRARAEAAEAKLDDLKPLRHALEHSVSTTIHRGVVAERDKQRGMFLDAERQCEILMQQRDAAVALGKRLAHVVAVVRTAFSLWNCQCGPDEDQSVALKAVEAVHADARKARWLT